jgi:hypothetical protein
MIVFLFVFFGRSFAGGKRMIPWVLLFCRFWEGMGEGVFASALRWMALRLGSLLVSQTLSTYTRSYSILVLL